VEGDEELALFEMREEFEERTESCGSFVCDKRGVVGLVAVDVDDVRNDNFSCCTIQIKYQNKIPQIFGSINENE